jgi:hypothetical protein
MPSKKEQNEQIRLDQIELRDIKLSESDRKKLLGLAAGCLVVFALAIVVYNAIAPHTIIMYDYPGGCGNSTIAPEGVDPCLTALANRTQNVTYCLYIKDSAEPQCVLNVAFVTQNVSYCGAIASSSPYFSQCIMTLNQKYNSIALCNYLSASTALQCIYNISSQSNFTNPNLCSQLTNASYDSECNNLYYYKNALSTKNSLYCGKLQTTRNTTTLYFINSNSSQSQDFTIQRLLLFSTVNVTPQQECYYNLAVVSNNESMCNNIGGGVASQCSYAVAQYNASKVYVDYNATNVTSSCGSYIAGGYSSNVCILEYLTRQAITKDNITFCKDINSSSYSDSCILGLALNTSNISYCSQIINSTTRNECNFVENSTNKTN